MTAIDISYVLPAHNAESVLSTSLTALAERFVDDPREAEVIVVENGSTDATWRIAQDAAVHRRDGIHIKAMQSPKGFGAAMRAGVAETSGGLVVATGCDLPFGFTDLDAVESDRGPTPAVFVGSKRHPDSAIEGRPMSRSVMTLGFAAVRRAMLASNVRDTQGSLLLSGDIGRGLCRLTLEDGFLITTEIIELAHRCRAGVREVPVKHRASDELSTVRPVVDSVAMLSGLRRVAQHAKRVASAGPIDVGPQTTAEHA